MSNVTTKLVSHKKYTCRMASDGSLHAIWGGTWHRGGWNSIEKRKPNVGEMRVIDGVLCQCLARDMTFDSRYSLSWFAKKRWDCIWTPFKMPPDPDWKAISQSVVAQQKGRTGQQTQKPK